jgi:hypothetical protein
VQPAHRALPATQDLQDLQDTGNTGATGPVGDYVISFNGYTGAVTGWASYNDGAGSGLDTDLIRGISGERFVENLQSGLLYGGLLTVNAGNTATFDVTAGRGIIVTPGGSTSGYPNAVISYINWAAQTGLTVANLAAYENTWVKINSSGNIVQSTTKWTDSEYDNSIPLGVLVHPNNTSINFAVAVPHMAYGQPSQLDPFVRAFGPIKISGHEISANGANLQVNKSTGAAYMIGRNYTTNPDSPNVVEDTNATPISTVYRYYRDGTGKFAVVTNSSIDPTKWDDGTGTLNSVAGGLYTIQRLFFLPGVPDVIAAYYGRQTYNSIQTAQANIPFETFSEDDSTANLGVFGGYLIVKSGTTQLNNTSDAKFINSGIFRNLSNIGGGGVAATSIDDLTDVTITSATNGEVLKYNGSSWVNGTAVTSFNGLVGAVQGVSAAVAGTGIFVSGATGSVTITNTGVQSFNGLTGAVTGVTQINAGTGIAITGTTNPTVTNTGVLSVNGSTGAITNVARTNVDNNFTSSQTISDIFATLTVHDNDIPSEFIIDPVNQKITYLSDTTGSNFDLVFPTNTRTVTLPGGANTTLAGLAVNQTFTGSNTFTKLVTFNDGITASGITLTGPLFLSSGQGITTAVTTVNGVTGAIGAVSIPGFTSATNVYTWPTGVTSFTAGKTPWYQPYWITLRDTSGFAVYPNRTYFMLHHTPRTIAIKAIRIAAANTVTTGNCFLSVYSADSNTGLPVNRLYSSPSIPVTAGYSYPIIQNTVSGLVTVPAGYFYLAASFSSSPIIYTYHNQYGLSIYGASDVGSGYRNHYWVADTNGFTAPSVIPQSGVTFALVDYHPSSYTGVRIEYQPLV